MSSVIANPGRLLRVTGRATLDRRSTYDDELHGYLDAIVVEGRTLGDLIRELFVDDLPADDDVVELGVVTIEVSR